MKALVVHNAYSSRVPSGENVSVGSEIDWLREAGVDVDVHQVSNDALLDGGSGGRLRAGLEAVWSRRARQAFSATLAASQPDLVHVHNLFPLLSASVPWDALRHSLPVVWTVRNWRITCVDGTHYRDDAPCARCHRGWRAPGIRFGCYNDSRLASTLITGATSVFGAIARRRLTTVAISDHVRQGLIDSAGFHPDQVRVKYNGIAPPPDDLELKPPQESRVLLFVGKLAEYKGVRLMLDAWEQVAGDDVELHVLGEGPLSPEVTAAAERDRRIRHLGQVPAREVGRHLALARAVIVPSTWEEPFGRTAAEALAYGRPVITTGSGGLKEVVDERSAWVTGSDPLSVARAITEALGSDGSVEARSRAAVDRYRATFSPEATTSALLEIYDSVLGRDGAG